MCACTSVEREHQISQAFQGSQTYGLGSFSYCTLVHTELRDGSAVLCACKVYTLQEFHPEEKSVTQSEI
jgi:hypothetical protein